MKKLFCTVSALTLAAAAFFCAAFFMGDNVWAVSKPTRVTSLRATSFDTACDTASIKWKSQKSADGYAVTINTYNAESKTSSKVKIVKTNKTSINLTSYTQPVSVKVRAYKKKKNGKKLYGTWSKTLTLANDKVSSIDGEKLSASEIYTAATLDIQDNKLTRLKSLATWTEKKPLTVVNPYGTFNNGIYVYEFARATCHYL